MEYNPTICYWILVIGFGAIILFILHKRKKTQEDFEIFLDAFYADFVQIKKQETKLGDERGESLSDTAQVITAKLKDHFVSEFEVLLPRLHFFLPRSFIFASDDADANVFIHRIYRKIMVLYPHAYITSSLEKLSSKIFKYAHAKYSLEKLSSKFFTRVGIVILQELKKDATTK
ncbi:MAG: hypothetical protein WCL18_08690 [bacterium]